MIKYLPAAVAVVGVIGVAHGQTLPPLPPLPPLQPPPATWCAFREAPDGEQGRACATLEQWRQATKVVCLRADAIGAPPPLSQDNTSPYWQAESSCSSFKVALDSVERAAQAAEESYRKALVARQQLGER